MRKPSWASSVRLLPIVAACSRAEANVARAGRARLEQPGDAGMVLEDRSS